MVNHTYAIHHYKDGKPEVAMHCGSDIKTAADGFEHYCDRLAEDFVADGIDRVTLDRTEGDDFSVLLEEKLIEDDLDSYQTCELEAFLGDPDLYWVDEIEREVTVWHRGKVYWNPTLGTADLNEIAAKHLKGGEVDF